MRKIVPLIAVLVFAIGMAYGAQRETKRETKRNPQWPSDNAIQKAKNKEKFRGDKAATAKVNGKLAKFIPADLGGYEEHDIAPGVIFGKLEIDGASNDKLPAGAYRVYVRKDAGDWDAFFVKEGSVFAKSKRVQLMQHGADAPQFVRGNQTIHYWWLQFDF